MTATPCFIGRSLNLTMQDEFGLFYNLADRNVLPH
jgi:hypothetical protein